MYLKRLALALFLFITSCSYFSPLQQDTDSIKKAVFEQKKIKTSKSCEAYSNATTEASQKYSPRTICLALLARQIRQNSADKSPCISMDQTSPESDPSLGLRAKVFASSLYDIDNGDFSFKESTFSRNKFLKDKVLHSTFSSNAYFSIAKSENIKPGNKIHDLNVFFCPTPDNGYTPYFYSLKNSFKPDDENKTKLMNHKLEPISYTKILSMPVVAQLPNIPYVKYFELKNFSKKNTQDFLFIQRDFKGGNLKPGFCSYSENSPTCKVIYGDKSFKSKRISKSYSINVFNENSIEMRISKYANPKVYESYTYEFDGKNLVFKELKTN